MVEREEEHLLIQRAKNGNDEAFAVLFQSNYMFLYKYLIKLSLQPDKTEDLVQETMLKAYVNFSRFKGEAKFSTWLISIASRLYIDQLRKEKSQRRLLEKIKAEAVRKMKWHMSLKGETWTDQLDMFSQMDPEVKIPVLLRHYYGYTYAEIAGMLNMKEGTVKSRVHNSLKEMRKEWSSEKQ